MDVSAEDNRFKRNSIKKKKKKDPGHYEMYTAIQMF